MTTHRSSSILPLRNLFLVVSVVLAAGWCPPPAAAQDGAEQPAPTPRASSTPSRDPGDSDSEGSESTPKPTASPDSDSSPAPPPEPSSSSSAPTAPSGAGPSPTATPSAALARVFDASSIGAGEICAPTPAGPVANDDGNVTIDLGLFAGPAVLIESSATQDCRNTLKSLTFLSNPAVSKLTIEGSTFSQIASSGNNLRSVSFPSGLRELIIGEAVFTQHGASNALKAVAFPSGLKTLRIGASAFYQVAEEDANSLKSVSFPAGLNTLQIGESAFEQNAYGGSNALAEVTFPEGPSELTVGMSAFAQSAYTKNALSEVTFPDSLNRLDVGAYAFNQYSSGGNRLRKIRFPAHLDDLKMGPFSFAQSAYEGANALEGVSFPTGLGSLDVAEYAFSQMGSAHPNSLVAVVFPEGLRSLRVREYAFYQSTMDGNNVLASVAFPKGLAKLTVDSWAFYQSSYYGRNALAKIAFPPGMETLILRQAAFAQMNDGDTVALVSVRIPEIEKELHIESYAFEQYNGGKVGVDRVVFAFSTLPESIYLDAFMLPESTKLMWFGADSPDTSTWPGNTARHSIMGYRQLILDDSVGGRKLLYVYPDGRATSRPLSGEAESIGKSSDWATSLPGSTKAEFAFAGWCAEQAPDHEACTGSKWAAGQPYKVGAPQQALYGTWKLLPPVIKTTELTKAVQGKSYGHELDIDSGGPVTCSIITGTLPAGIDLSGCALRGVPAADGVHRFTVSAANEGGSHERQFTLSIAGTETLSKVGPEKPQAASTGGKAGQLGLADTGANPASLLMVAFAFLLAGTRSLRSRLGRSRSSQG